MTTNYICNPLNVPYRYQFNKPQIQGMLETAPVQVAREAADPSMICFHGKYYIFASMTLSVWVSEDLVHWESYRLPDYLPLYDYAPDARVVGEYVYFCASKKEKNCDFYRTKDIINGPYEKIEGSFPFWDPNLFVDDDGRMYFYWGCANMTPLYGVELDSITMKPLSEKKELIWGNAWEKGYERNGMDHCDSPCSEEEIETRYQEFLKHVGANQEQMSENMRQQIRGHVSKKPFIEGAWMTKYKGKYYLQYACPGTEYNIYCDGVYVSDSPLGSFELAGNNPYSYKPGGFLPGAGHGSTMWDNNRNLWHASTMSIGINHIFERRVGLWPAGFDEDGELFCNQRYGDWPLKVEQAEMNPWRNPDWYLISYKKKMTASTAMEGRGPEYAVDEDIHTWWRAATEEPGQWIHMDLGKNYDVHAVQVNFADDTITIPPAGEIIGESQARYIEERNQVTRWILESSVDGKNYSVLADKSKTETNLPHDLIVIESGVQIRYLKLIILQIPYDQKPCISGLRVFGMGDGVKPKVPQFVAERVSDIDLRVKIQTMDAIGYNILWGHAPNNLYNNYMIYGKKEQNIGALVKGQSYYVRVDAFNENGITEGNIVALDDKA